jgi:hypothetical protein
MAEESLFDSSKVELLLLPPPPLPPSWPHRPCGPLKPIQWAQGPFSPGVKRPERKADHTSQASTEVKNESSYTLTSPQPSWRANAL